MLTHRSLAARMAALFSISALLSACGASARDDETATTDTASSLSAVEDRYLLVRRDHTVCASSSSSNCGGFVVHELNRGTEAQVTSVQLAVADSELARLIADAPDDELVVRGHLDAMPTAARTPALIVAEAFRGMPGMSAGAAKAFLTVNAGDCTADDCLPASAIWLNLTERISVGTLTLSHAEAPFVDAEWLRDRVLARGAIVAGTVTADGIDAAQVFVRIPDSIGPCPTIAAPACTDGTVPVFAREGGRCLLPTGCSYPGVCAMYLPRCAEGYTLHSWMAGSPACPAYACDPSFLSL
jgi:hypothetical protein